MVDELVQEIFSDRIELPPHNMRKDIDRDELHMLAENIKANGLISPLTVRPKGGMFELVAGQRRLLACRIAGIIRIPCVVRDLSDAEAFAVMTAENLERRDVDPVDEAMHLKRHIDMTGETARQLAERINRSEQYVRDRLVIADMPSYMQTFLKTGQIKIGVALLLSQIEPESKRELWTSMAVHDNASTRTVEYWLYQHKLGLLPEVVNDASDVPGAPEQAKKPMMLTCSVDGQDYPASEMTAVFVWRENVHLLDALRSELSRGSPPAESESPAESPAIGVQ